MGHKKKSLTGYEGCSQDVKQGHVEHDGQCIPGRQATSAGLVKTECVKGNALDHEDDDLDDHGFGQIRRLAVDDEGVMGKDEDDQGDAQIACVVEHEGVAARFQHGCVIMADTGYDIGDDEADEHEDGNGGDDIDTCCRELRRIDVGEDETGDDQEEHELRQGLDVEVEFLIEEIA